MSIKQDPLKYIAQQVETKSTVKQQVFRNLQHVFESLKSEADHLINKVKDNIENRDRDISLEVTAIAENEFHLRIAGDLLIFLMHTNVITLDKEHGLNKTSYVQEGPMRKYLGQINVYNFMADSLKYNRLSDPGYLIARLFINVENHFLVEGNGQLNFMFEDISSHPVKNVDLNIFIQLAISQAMDSDLITPPFPTVRSITLNQKLEKSQALGGGYKIGFQMRSQESVQ